MPKKKSLFVVQASTPDPERGSRHQSDNNFSVYKLRSQNQPRQQSLGDTYSMDKRLGYSQKELYY